MPIPVTSGDKKGVGVVIGGDTADISDLQTEPITLSPTPTPFHVGYNVRKVEGVTLTGSGATTNVDTGQSSYQPEAVVSIKDSSRNEYIKDSDLSVDSFYLSTTYKIDITNDGTTLSNMTIYYI